MMKAEDVMTATLVSVDPGLSLLDVLRLFVEEDIHGAPVVDEDGGIVGSITTTDLLRAVEDEHDTAWVQSDYLRNLVEFSLPDWSGDLTDFQDRLSQRSVAEVMTKQLLTVPRTATLDRVARCLRESRVHRVWVEDGGRLCGVISALDLMPVLEELAASS